MTTSLPAWITWPALTLILVVVLARYRWFNSTKMETIFNNFLAIALLSNLLRERAIEQFLDRNGILSVTASQQLSLVVVIFAAAVFMGFIELWANPEASVTRFGNRFQLGLAAALAAAFLAAATPARRAGQTLEEFGGWSSVLAWLFLVTNLVMFAFKILHMSIAELRSAALKRRERLIAIAGVGIGLMIGLTSLEAPVVAVLGQLGMVDSASILTRTNGLTIFIETVAVAVLAAVPLAVSVAGMMGGDATSRSWRKLQPMRSDLAAVVPTTTVIIASSRRRKSTLDLHQTNVAIRDSILQLLPYVRDLDHHAAAEYRRGLSVVRPSQRRYAEQALRLADALAARAAGEPPAEVESTSGIALKRSADLEDETTEMLRLARWWTFAKSAGAATCSCSPSMTTPRKATSR